MLVGRDGARLGIATACAWALTWAVGAGLGVALGGYLTLVSGSGAPGTNAIDPATDLVVLPAIAFVTVFAVGIGGRIVVGAVRGRRVSQPPRNSDKDHERDAEDRVGR